MLIGNVFVTFLLQIIFHFSLSDSGELNSIIRTPGMNTADCSEICETNAELRGILRRNWPEKRMEIITVENVFCSYECYHASDVSYFLVLYPNHEIFESVPLECDDFFKTVEEYPEKSKSVAGFIMEYGNLKYYFPESKFITVTNRKEFSKNLTEFYLGRIGLYFALEMLTVDGFEVENYLPHQLEAIGSFQRRLPSTLFPHEIEETKELLEHFQKIIKSDVAFFERFEIDQLWHYYFPLSQYITNLRSERNLQTIFVGINGFPGAGKTISARILEKMLKIDSSSAQTNNVVRLSIDDFYYTNSERDELGITDWGLPSQDLLLLYSKLGELRDLLSPSSSVEIPIFDKSYRIRQSETLTVHHPVQYVVLEGMNVGCVIDMLEYLDLTISLHVDVDLLYNFKRNGVLDDLLRREDFTAELFEKKFTWLWGSLIKQFDEFMPKGNKNSDLVFQVGFDHLPIEIYDKEYRSDCEEN